MNILGIDPGAHGAAVEVSETGDIIVIHDNPTTKEANGRSATNAALWAPKIRTWPAPAQSQGGQVTPSGLGANATSTALKPVLSVGLACSGRASAKRERERLPNRREAELNGLVGMLDLDREGGAPR